MPKEVTLAIQRYHRGEVSVEEVLELAGVGPSTIDHGLIGGGKGAAAPKDHEFSVDDFIDYGATGVSEERIREIEAGDKPYAEKLEQWRRLRARASREAENAEQFDIWQIKPHDAKALYALSWRDDSGRAHRFEGFFESTADVVSFLSALYLELDYWIRG